MSFASARLASSPLLLRSSLRPSPISSSRILQSRLLSQRATFSTFHALKAASSVSGKPGSQDASSMKENAKQEIKSVTSDIASAISGGNDPHSTSQVAGGSLQEMEQSVSSLTGLAGNVPKEAWVFGAAGFIPYIGTSLSSVYLAKQVQLAETAGSASRIDYDTALALLHHVELIQLSFGAVILSFLGALHWGFEFAAYNGRKGTPRYLIGIFPVLVGWPSLLLGGQLALAAQWAAFAAVWYVDSRATARGWTPKWFSTYRFALTAVVGSSLLLTMGATGYYTAGTGSAASKLKNVKNGPKPNATMTEENASPRIEGKVGGDFSTESGTDAYVVFENEEKKREEEEKKKQEEEEEKKKQQEEEAKNKKEAVQKKAREARDKAEGKQ